MASRKQKKQTRQAVFIILGIAMLVVGAWVFNQWRNYRKAKFTRYPEFGILMPESYSIHGIDVSKYQDMIAWEEVQAMKVKKIQLGFAFIKATQGIGNTDPNFNLYIQVPSVDALQEFKVQSGIYPAEFGREAGQVNVSTKSGGNGMTSPR